jgi:hypothetical protein
MIYLDKSASSSTLNGQLVKVQMLQKAYYGIA